MRRDYIKSATFFVIRAVVAGALLLSVRAVFAQETPGTGRVTEGFPQVVPTRLGSFIAETKGVIIEKHDLGTLTGRGTAKFYAVIARDPANSDAVERGMEIDLKDGERHARVYPDEAHLGKFEQDLRWLAGHKEETIEFHRRRNPRPSDTWSTLAQDHPDFPLPEPAWADVPRVGLYGIEAKHEVGVVILVLRRGRNRDYYFPEADLSTVANFIAAGRKWLSENH